MQETRGMGLIPGLGRSPGGAHGNPLQYSSLENPMDRGAWQATVYRVAQSQTQLKWLTACAHTHTHILSLTHTRTHTHTHTHTLSQQCPDVLSGILPQSWSRGPWCWWTRCGGSSAQQWGWRRLSCIPRAGMWKGVEAESTTAGPSV